MITWFAKVKFFDYTVNMMVHADNEHKAKEIAALKVRADYGFPNPKVVYVREM